MIIGIRSYLKSKKKIPIDGVTQAIRKCISKEKVVQIVTATPSDTIGYEAFMIGITEFETKTKKRFSND